MALTPKQKIFADEYLVDLNATRAYKVAYSRVKNEETAAVIIPGLIEPPVRTLRATVPENGSHRFR